MRNILALPLILAAFLFAGCAALQQATPETPREALVVSYIALNRAAETASEQYNKGRITYKQKNDIADKLTDAYDNLTVARSYLNTIEAGSSEPDFETRLGQVNAVLSVIEVILQEQVK